MDRIVKCIKVLGERKCSSQTQAELAVLGISIVNGVGDIKETSEILLELSDLWHENKKVRYQIKDSLYPIVGIRYQAYLLGIIKDRELIELLREIMRD